MGVVAIVGLSADKGNRLEIHTNLLALMTRKVRNRFIQRFPTIGGREKRKGWHDGTMWPFRQRSICAGVKQQCSGKSPETGEQAGVKRELVFVA